MRRLLITKWFPLVLISLTFLVYAPSLPGEFYFDDGFLLDSEAVTDLKNLPILFQGGQQLSPMRGISITTFAIQYQFFGWNAGAFRAFNVVLHFFNSWLVWIITRNLVKRVRELNTCGEVPIVEEDREVEILPVFTALGFVVHPVFTSGVSYIFQRNGLLSTWFYLLAFYFLLRAFPLGQSIRTKWILLSCGMYLLSTWSKEIGITFIVIVFLFEWLLQPKEGRKNRVWWYFPLAGICLFSLAMAFWQMVRTPILKRTIYGEWSIWQNVVTQWKVIVEYLKLILWPHPNRLNIDHDFPIALSLFDQWAWFSGLVLLGILVCAFWIRQRNPLLAFSIFWFFITLMPEATIIPISEVMVEYRLYLPGFGFILALTQMLKIFSEKLKSKSMFLVGNGLILMIFSVFTFQRNLVMKNAFLVWQDTAQKAPYNVRAQTAYATYLKNQGQLHEAMAIYKKAIDLNEMGIPFKLSMVQPHNEFGVYLAELGEWKQARDQFIAALRINRWFKPSLENLTALMERADQSDYEKNYLAVFEQVDHFPIGHYNLGNFYMRNRHYEKAVTQFEIAIRQKRNFYEAYNNMGTAYIQLDKWNKAQTLFKRALEIKPDFKTAHDNLKSLDPSRLVGRK